MGVSSLLAHAAARRAHVLIAEAPGAFRARVALENELARLGWQLADSVADADVLAVVGQPAGELAEVFEHAWDQMSEPRARITVMSDADISRALQSARDALTAAAPGGDTLRDGQGVRSADQDHGADHHHEGHGSHDHGGHGGQESHEGHDHGEDYHHEGHEGHGGHDHGDMDMAPDGIPLAIGAPDRDGLEMDELHLPLGPVLRWWPPGITLTLTLHGDVVADASLRDLAGDRRESAEPDDRSARLLDAAHSALSLAGATGLAALARRARNRSLSGSRDTDRLIEDLARRLRRARVLRWSLRGLVPPHGELPPDALFDRILGLVEDARTEPGDANRRPGEPGMAGEDLPELVCGQELSAVRIWMATIVWEPAYV